MDSELVQRIQFGTIEKYAQIGGICVASEGVVYVTHSWENCVKVVSATFQDICEIGKDILTAPKDVKVFVCLFIYLFICLFVLLFVDNTNLMFSVFCDQKILC